MVTSAGSSFPAFMADAKHASLQLSYMRDLQDRHEYLDNKRVYAIKDGMFRAVTFFALTVTVCALITAIPLVAPQLAAFEYFAELAVSIFGLGMTLREVFVLISKIKAIEGERILIPQRLEASYASKVSNPAF